MKRLLVIGGGLAGLSAAWHARRAGAEVRLLESANQAGGVVRTFCENGFLAETGPNTILASSPALLKLLGDLGLENEIVETTPSAQQRFVVRNGKLVTVPTSMGRILTTRLIGFAAKLRLLAEPLAAGRPKDTPGEESLADFVRRRLGVEAFIYGLEPFAAGVFAGNPEKLAVRYAFPRLQAMEREHGSLTRAAIHRLRHRRTNSPPRLISFQQGMGTLPRALATQLGDALTLQARLLSLERTAEGLWQATWETPALKTHAHFDGVVLAAPAHALVKIPLSKELAAQLASLEKIEYPPVSAVVLGYPRHKVSHPLDGFGVLIPAVEPFKILGVLFNSSMFQGRAPAGFVTLTVFVGGARHPENAALPDDALLALVTGDLKKLLHAQDEPVYTRIARWPCGIPQYNLDHGTMLAAITETESLWPGLTLAGSYHGGVSVPQCLETGRVAGLRALNLSPSAVE